MRMWLYWNADRRKMGNLRLASPRVQRTSTKTTHPPTCRNRCALVPFSRAHSLQLVVCIRVRRKPSPSAPGATAPQRGYCDEMFIFIFFRWRRIFFVPIVHKLEKWMVMHAWTRAASNTTGAGASTPCPLLGSTRPAKDLRLLRPRCM